MACSVICILMSGKEMHVLEMSPHYPKNKRPVQVRDHDSTNTNNVLGKWGKMFREHGVKYSGNMG